MNQRLRGIINTFGLNLGLEKLAKAFTQHFRSKEIGTLRSDMQAFESSPEYPQTVDQNQPNAMKKLDNLICKLLQVYEEEKAQQGTQDGVHAETSNVQSWRQVVRLGVKHDKFSRHGVSFSTLNHIQQDSYVAVGKKVPNDWQAGRILSIFTYTHRGPTPALVGHTETYFVLQKFEELMEVDEIHDPYRKHPFIGGRLYYDKVKDPELVSQEEILCHFAYTPFKHSSIALPCIHALPLDRVC